MSRASLRLLLSAASYAALIWLEVKVGDAWPLLVAPAALLAADAERERRKRGPRKPRG